ncbi:tRNA-modifying protein YgfZ [Alishewanella longhuensis]|uniref:tRNA-modifying protein YgfZ n=1 Tax=Alishewanella longhuensis TaxID=1091037 RepID=A0ABQ3KYY2_9ALTE|nr:tRNA-modifying protein YgfZ [Alishewanella longhuensis]GHG65235.1 tRNA-modifying protein YgfZ [Alishewanella longhuensis]
MQTSWLTAEQYAHLSTQVQGAFIAPLPAFQVLTISGPDNLKYLQGQSTCDLSQLTADNFLRGAHCDAKGKMWSIFQVFSQADCLQVVAFRDELIASTAQWQKFGVFSKVSFDATAGRYAVFGIGGAESAQLLAKLGFSQPSADGHLSRYNDAALLRLAADHYLLIVPQPQAQQLMQSPLPFAAPTLWLKAHILQGLAYLEQPLIGELVPQMLNLQAVNAISFTKGCYVGQETVARLKYRGGNKRAAYVLEANTNELPVAGSDIELQLENNWRRVGQVVNAVNINNQLWLIALLPNDITPAETLRLKSEQLIILQQLPLPYSLT